MAHQNKKALDGMGDGVTGVFTSNVRKTVGPYNLISLKYGQDNDLWS
jgi:hypothetical protein